jgi:hypothetical protein
MYVGQCLVEYTVHGKRYSLWAASGYLDRDRNFIADKMRECPVPLYFVHYNPKNPADALAIRADVAEGKDASH